MKPKIVVHHHTGLGDHFICNGLVHKLLEEHSVDLICKQRYLKTVKHLYEDFSDVTIVPVDNAQEDAEVFKYCNENSLALMRVGFEKTDYQNFEDSFYNSAGISPDAEYENFVFPKNLNGSEELLNKMQAKFGKEYIFIHDESSYAKFDLRIDSNLPRWFAKKEDTDDVLDYVAGICNAKEVHVINSGLNNLVFQLFYKGMVNGKVFYHDARKPNLGGIPVKVPDGIEIVEYE